MKNRALRSLLRNFAPLAIILVVAILSWVNYTPGTWLSGWDTLHPEFNLSFYFKRIFWGVWQEHQGLGAIASQAHAGELPRLLVLYLFSLLFPPDFSRYAYFFLTLVVGTLGIYFFLNTILTSQGASRRIASFCGALVYLLNLAVLQHYYVPLEMFATHFATLPWLFLFASKYIEGGKRRGLILFSLLTFFATSIAHTPTLFFVYFTALVLYVGAFGLFTKIGIRRILLIILTTLIVNSFWLFPSLYFIKNHGADVVDSKIHMMFSDRAFLTGQKFGTLADTAIFKNFLFEWGEYSKEKGKFVDLFDEWKLYLGGGITFVGYIVFSLVIAGIAVSIRTRNKYGFAFLPLFITSFLVIYNNLPGWSQTFSLLQEKIPLFREALRFPFTKFSILLAFSFAIYSTLALDKILSIARSRVLNGLVGFGIPFLLVLHMLSAFKGSLISPSMKVKIPEEYFQMFDWFSKQDYGGRIAEFPIHTFWGWVYYDWGYEGAGFLWFGLPQPLLDREFDRWSPHNENYYWEASYAVYSRNQELFEKILEKYQIRWLLIDKNVFNPSSPQSTAFAKLDELIRGSGKISPAQTFGNIQIYKVNLETPATGFVFLAQNLPSVVPAYNWNNLDTAYLESGNYISLPASNLQLPTAYYPFRSLFTGKEQKDLEFQIEELPTSFVLKSKIPAQLKNYRAEIPKADAQDLLAFPQRAFIANGYLHVLIPKIGSDLARDIDLSGQELPSCTKAQGVAVELVARGNTTCRVAIPLEALPHNVSYLITVKNQNVKGKPIVFWLENLNSRKADIETNLPKVGSLKESFFVQPPMDPFGRGYILHFDNISIGKEEVINRLGEIRIQPLPFDFLRSIKLVPPNSPSTSTLLSTPRTVVHPNPAFYEIGLDEVPFSATLVLSQGYEKGWVAYALNSNFHFPLSNYLAPLLGQEIKEHVLVNNWANGWQLEPSEDMKTIVILYLPQYLEFLGFLLLLGFGISLIVRRKQATLPLR